MSDNALSGEHLPDHWSCTKPGLIWLREDGLTLEFEATPGFGWGLPLPIAWVWSTHTVGATWDFTLKEQRFLIEWFSRRAWVEEVEAKLTADRNQGKKNKFMRTDNGYAVLSVMNLLEQGVSMRRAEEHGRQG